MKRGAWGRGGGRETGETGETGEQPRKESAGDDDYFLLLSHSSLGTFPYFFPALKHKTLVLVF